MNIYFDASLIKLNVDCQQPKDAIHIAGHLLLDSKLCTENYISAMKNGYKEFGAYIVLDDGIAMPHARSESGAILTGLSIVVLKNPLKFGHETFDPVRVVVAIVSKDQNFHIELIQLVAKLIENNLADICIKAKNKDQILEFVKSFY